MSALFKNTTLVPGPRKNDEINCLLFYWNIVKEEVNDIEGLLEVWRFFFLLFLGHMCNVDFYF